MLRPFNCNRSLASRRLLSRSVVISLLLIAAISIPGWRLLTRPAFAAGVVVTVNTTDDLSDINPGDGICDASLDPDSQCTLRAAIEELNSLGADSPPHRIEFAMTGPAPFTITPASALPDITVPVVIDGQSQAGATCPTATEPANLLIVLDGRDTGPSTNGLTFFVGSDGSTVRGLVIGNFTQNGLVLSSSAGNRVECNHIGVSSDGVTDIGNATFGIIVTGSGNTIGGDDHEDRNVISGNGSNGIRISQAADTFITNNWIGTTADGMGALSNSGGIYVGGNGNHIGFTGTAAPNIVSGNVGYGIRVNSVSGNVVRGNWIGLARDGLTALGNSSTGIEVTGLATDNLIGGIEAGAGNRISHNGSYGVMLNENVIGIPARNAVRGNAVSGNGDLGIDLGNDGVDLNDTGDSDSGENDHQNYPGLSSAPGSLSVTVTLESKAATQYHIDIYRSAVCDSSGYGEGSDFLDTLTIETDGAGHGEFTTDLVSLASVGDYITATATDPQGNTSEFSACVILEAAPTATPTATPSPTSTRTATATRTATTVPTATHTSTPTATRTAGTTPSPTQTAAASPSSTAPATATPSATTTAATTATATPSPSATRTVTRVVSPTATSTQEPARHSLYLPLARK